MTLLLENAINRHVTRDWARDELDWYVEPSWTWDVLERCVPSCFDGVVLDPSCGGGVGLDWCRARGHQVWGSDIEDRGCGAVIADFLDPDYPMVADSVVCNPPYRHAIAFAERGLDIARHSVALLVPLPFLASQRRHRLFTSTPVSDVVILSKRPSMPPGGMGIKVGGGKEDFAWIVWRHLHDGPVALHWGMP